MRVTLFSPAKLNLFLAITGRRADGFHDLVSVVAPLAWGDTLEAWSEEREAGNQKTAAGSPREARFTLECDAPGVPVDETNLVIKAAQAFAAASGWGGSVHFKLAKRIPAGAGLGGGSSNAVAALRALNELAGTPLAHAQLETLATQLGSDCALFLRDRPVVMRGRGEQVENLPAGAVARLRGRRVLVFKPSFGIATPWAYRRMIERGSDYLPAAEAEARLARWLGSDAPAEALLANNMQPAAFGKYVAMPLLLGKLRAEFAAAALMSGSGSACFVLLAEGQDERPIEERIRADWGEGAVLGVTRLA